LSGLLSTTIVKVFPAFEPVMRYLSAVYILYLAVSILKASYAFTEETGRPLGFVHGFVLQILNPKLFVYAFTLFSAFLATMTKNTIILLLVVTLLAMVAFCATSTWALFGMAIKSYLQHPRLKMFINIFLSLSLVYTAISLTGIF
jgi:threonine/homoserine/homoserine lactone efflux protein